MREAHRQLLDRDVVHDLVVGALQEGRIDRGERLVAFGREAGREGHARAARRCRRRRCASGNALPNRSRPVPRRHRGGDGDDLVVLLRFLDQALAEHLGVGRRVRLRLRLHAGDDVELDHAVILVGATPRPARSPCPSGSRHGPGSGPARRRARSSAPAAGGRGCARRSGRHSRSRAPRTACRRSRKPRAYSSARCAFFSRPLRQCLCASCLPISRSDVIGAARDQPRQIGRHRADRRRDRHVVVVEDDDQARVHRAGIVHRLVGHAGRHRAVADHRDDVVVLPPAGRARPPCRGRPRSRSRNARRRTGRIRSPRAW